MQFLWHYLVLGVGAATGDPAKAAGMAMAAGTAGYNFTNYYGDKAAKGIGEIGGKAWESGRVGFWGEDYKKIEQHKFDKEFMKDPETINALTKSLGSREAAMEAIADGRVQKVLNNNITDKTMAAKTLKLAQKYRKNKDHQYDNLSKMSDDQLLARAITMAKSARDLNPAVFVTMSDEQNKFREVMRQRGYSNGLIDQLLDEMDEFNT